MQLWSELGHGGVDQHEDTIVNLVCPECGPQNTSSHYRNTAILRMVLTMPFYPSCTSPKKRNTHTIRRALPVYICGWTLPVTAVCLEIQGFPCGNMSLQLTTQQFVFSHLYVVFIQLMMFANKKPTMAVTNGISCGKSGFLSCNARLLGSYYNRRE